MFSFQAASNCTEFPLERINLQNLGTALQVNRSEVLEILTEISRGTTPRFQSSHNKWRISYVSGDSFDENKRRGWNYRQTSQQSRLLNNLCAVSPFRADTVIRGFKTERNVKAELERNPTFSGRARRWMGLSPTVYQVTMPMPIAFLLSFSNLYCVNKSRVLLLTHPRDGIRLIANFPICFHDRD